MCSSLSTLNIKEVDSSYTKDSYTFYLALQLHFVDFNWIFFAIETFAMIKRMDYGRPFTLGVFGMISAKA